MLCSTRPFALCIQKRLQLTDIFRGGKFLSTSATSSGEKQGASFHKRPLPPNLIALSSKRGKELFREAYDQGTLESYFSLAEQFITQSEPSYCSISSLAMVLNALNFDPKRIWKGSWRWVSEDMLHCESKALCGHTEEKVRKDGMSFAEFETLARCHGVGIQGFRACHPANISCGSQGFKKFYDTVETISRSDKNDVFLVTNFSRKHLSQTGDGHFSPIAAFHKEAGYVLVLDVARFKYPPYWVKIEDMWDSMAAIDKATNKPRGYFLISSWEGGVSSSLSAPTIKCSAHEHGHHTPHSPQLSVCHGSEEQQSKCKAVDH